MAATTTESGTTVASQGTPVYDALGNYTGMRDDSPAPPPPSPDIAKPAENTPPSPSGGPIVIAKQIKMDAWTIYVDGDNLYAKAPNGKLLQIVMFDPTGVTENLKPNKLSDGSDGSKGTSIGGNNVPIGSQIKIQNPTAANLAAANAANAMPMVPQTVVTLPSIPNIGINLPFPLFFTDFLPTFYPDVRGIVSDYLARAIDDTEWANLIAATYSESGRDPREQAWVAGSILNRARDTGMNVSSILNSPAQYPSVRGWTSGQPSQQFVQGPPPAVEQNIYQSWLAYLPEVPKNNYWFNSVNPPELPPDGCVVTLRDGVQGVLVGQSLVYPGVRWTP